MSVRVYSVPQHTRDQAPGVDTRAPSSPAHLWPGPFRRYACTQFPSTLVARPLVSVRVHTVPQHTRGLAPGVGTRALSSPAHSWPGPWCRYACTQFPSTLVARPLVSVHVHSVPQHTRGPAPGVGTRALSSSAHSWPGLWCRPLRSVGSGDHRRGLKQKQKGERKNNYIRLFSTDCLYVQD